MLASNKLTTDLRIPDADVQDWIFVIRTETASIKAPENRQRRLVDIRDYIDAIIIAEVDSRFRDRMPVEIEEIYRLTDGLFREAGITDVPLR